MIETNLPCELFTFYFIPFFYFCEFYEHAPSTAKAKNNFQHFWLSPLKLPVEESSMDGEEGFLHAFGLCRICLIIIGLWPNLKNTKYSEAIAFFRFTVTVCLIVIFINYMQTLKLVAVWGDLNPMTNVISTADLPIGVAIIQMLIFCRHKKDLGRLIAFAREDWHQTKSPEDLETARSSARTAHKMSVIGMILGIGTVQSHLGMRAFQELNLFPGQVVPREPLFDSYVPYNYRPTPIYQITWTIQYIGGALATTAYCGMHCMFVALMLHLCGQFANLRRQMSSVGSGGSGEKFRARLGEIVRRHEKLNGFAQVIENVFNIMFMAEMFSATVQFCLQGFLLMTLASGDGGIPVLHLLFMIVFVTHMGSHVFMLCYVAEKLQDESVSISRAVYNSEWYNLAPEDASLLIIIMHRTRKPLQVTAGKFFVFSLSLYAQIFKTSGGYMSMLLAVKDRIT